MNAARKHSAKMAVDRRTRHIAIVVFVLASVVFAILGYIYYNFEKNKVILAQYQTLVAVDELKASTVQKWREERVAEANRVARKPDLVEIISQVSRDQQWQRRLETFLQLETAGRKQVIATLVDVHLNLLTSTGPPGDLSEASRIIAAKVLSTGEPQFPDIHRDSAGAVYVELGVPVRDAGGQVQAVLLARQDANVALFTLIRFWPVSSLTAESYLVRREGDQVVFLTDLRFHKGAPLALSLPLTETKISSVQAVLGKRGIFRGQDYRGVRVISDLQPVSGSDWFILSEIDEAEVISSVRGHAAEVIIIVLLSILLCGSVIALFYRKRQAGMLQGLVEAERQKTEILRHMQEAEEQKREILHAAIDGFLLLDTEGNILEVNEAFCGMLGWTAEELCQLRITDLEAVKTPEETAAHLQRILKAGKDRFENKLRRKDGTTIDVDVVVQVRRTERILVAFLRDITETKRFELVLKQATLDAQAASRAKSEFLAVMSHELRTPLNAVLGFSDFLVETPLDKKQQEFLQIIRSSGGHLLEVVNEILDFSSIEKGSVSLQKEKLLLASLIQQCCDSARRATKSDNVEFRCEPAPGLPEYFVGDERRIRQVLANIVGNALKFTTSGSVVLRVSPSSDVSDPAIDFAVADTGPGLAPDNIEKIFQPFTQADSSLGRVFGGTGLGLAIANRLARDMGATITVTSSLGQGSTFTFRHPLVQPGEDPAEASSDDATSLEAAAASGVVLIVEDDRVNRLLARKILESVGFRSESVSDGQAAIDAYAPGKYSAILMDVQMPVMDGLDATKRIREIELSSGGHVPIIALTANVMPGDRDRCIEAGMDDFLTKPFNKHQIRKVLLYYTGKNIFEA